MAWVAAESVREEFDAFIELMTSGNAIPLPVDEEWSQIWANVKSGKNACVTENFYCFHMWRNVGPPWYSGSTKGIRWFILKDGPLLDWAVLLWARGESHFARTLNRYERELFLEVIDD